VPVNSFYRRRGGKRERVTWKVGGYGQDVERERALGCFCDLSSVNPSIREGERELLAEEDRSEFQ
jgi:hypothetical protein